MDYNAKYLKYKTKYLNLKYVQMGGGLVNDEECNKLELEIKKTKRNKNAKKIAYETEINNNNKTNESLNNKFNEYKTANNDYDKTLNAYIAKCDINE